MEVFWIILIVIAVIALLALISAAICYKIVFYSPDRRKLGEGEYDLPPDDIYVPHHPKMIEWTDRARALPHRKVEIKTFDGLTLRGRYYEKSPDAPIEIMMHGYQGCLERDLSGGIFRALDVGHSVLVYDHRGSGLSDGNTLTFGINESKDCRRWIDFVINEINKDAKIILSGVSMGGATAMIVSGYDDLPENMVGIIADCGYTSAKEIIKMVIKDMKLPPDILYPFVRLGGLIFGRFDLEEFSPIDQVRKSKLPTIFVHGDDDKLVPLEMSKANYEACGAKTKRLLVVPGAGHGLAYIYAGEGYIDELHSFFDPVLESRKK